MEEYHVLAQAIHLPMQKWWGKTGFWGLVALLIILLPQISVVKAEIDMLAGYNFWTDWLREDVWWKVFLMGFWLSAACAASRLLIKHAPTTSSKHPTEQARARFAIIYAQGLIALAFVMIVRIVSSGIESWFQYRVIKSEVVSISVVQTLNIGLTIAIFALFLIALLELAPERPLLPWLWLSITIACMIIAQLIGASHVFIDAAGSNMPKQLTLYTGSWPGILLSAALYWGFLLLLYYHRKFWAMVAYTAILIFTVVHQAIFAVLIPLYLYSIYTLPGLLSSSGNALSIPYGILLNITAAAYYLPATLGIAPGADLINPHHQDFGYMFLGWFLPVGDWTRLFTALVNLVWAAIVFLLISTLVARSKAREASAVPASGE